MQIHEPPAKSWWGFTSILMEKEQVQNPRWSQAKAIPFPGYRRLILDGVLWLAKSLFELNLIRRECGQGEGRREEDIYNECGCDYIWRIKGTDIITMTWRKIKPSDYQIGMWQTLSPTRSAINAISVQCIDYHWETKMNKACLLSSKREWLESMLANQWPSLVQECFISTSIF